MNKNPLIHAMNNSVTSMFVADGILAYGGSALCSETPEEFSDLYKHIDGLMVNLGTLTDSKKKAVFKACDRAKEHGASIGIDPAGIHMSQWRMDTFKTLLDHYPVDFVRGNRDEIAYYLNPATHMGTKRLEALCSRSDDIYEKCLKDSKVMWLITGKNDLILGQNKSESIPGGSHRLRLITGAGCLLSALVAVNIGKGYTAYTACHLASSDLKTAAQTSASYPLGAIKQVLLTELHALGEKNALCDHKY